MTFHPWALLIALPPIIAALCLGRRIKKHEEFKREPFKDALLCPPGESCRQKVGVLHEEFIGQVLWLAAPIVFALGIFYAPASFWPGMVLALASLGFTVYTTNRLWKIWTSAQNYRLGFEGERLVGQFLNQLLAHGCKVYHDTQFESYNIDHVIIAPSGVYAVETKTRRKGLEAGSHKVTFDGQKLIYPGWEDDHGLEQAERNAKSLSAWLSSAVGESVAVKPILTLPGWLIERVGKGKVNVLNPKEILKVVLANAQPILSPQLTQRISHQIEQKSVIS